MNYWVHAWSFRDAVNIRFRSKVCETKRCDGRSCKCTLLFLRPKHHSHTYHTLSFMIICRVQCSRKGNGTVIQTFRRRAFIRNLSFFSQSNSFKMIWCSARCTVKLFDAADHTSTSHLCCITAWVITVSRSCRQAVECHRCAPPHGETQEQAAESSDPSREWQHRYHTPKTANTTLPFLSITKLL